MPYYPPSILPSINAITNPIIVAIPIFIPPSSKASGIIDSANITNMAPAAKDNDVDIIKGLVFDSKLKPIGVDNVPIITAIDYNPIMYL